MSNLPPPELPEWTDEEVSAAISEAYKSDTRIATVRTIVPAAWGTLVVYLLNRFGIQLDPDDTEILLLVLPAVIGIFYRLSRFVEERFPKLAWILLGSGKKPLFYA